MARIVVANGTLIRYQVGGGHWMVRMQWLLGLRQLGHDVLLLEIPTARRTNQDVERFFQLLKHWGLDDMAVVVLCAEDAPEDLDHAEFFGRTKDQTKEAIASADFVWNDCGRLRGPLLDRFRRRVLIDLDPGHLQVSGLEMDVGIDRHEAHLTVGMKMADADCEAPRLGVDWTPFLPPIHLPVWSVESRPPDTAPISSITHWWGWGELIYNGKRLSISKRDGYLRYLDLPSRVSVALELGIHFDAKDETGDADLLRHHLWHLVDPWEEATDAAKYQRYIARCLAELNCPKPIFRELRTGWFSDRSACYLASGRPVIAEDTGFSDHLPVGKGLVTFTSPEEAVDQIEDVVRHWDEHSAAARALAEEYFDARKVIQGMVDAS
jgi:hypothetical protein